MEKISKMIQEVVLKGGTIMVLHSGGHVNPDWLMPLPVPMSQTTAKSPFVPNTFASTLRSKRVATAPVQVDQVGPIEIPEKFRDPVIVSPVQELVAEVEPEDAPKEEQVTAPMDPRAAMIAACNPAFARSVFGKVSYYTRESSGPFRADGTPMNDFENVIAFNRLPLGSKVLVRNEALPELAFIGRVGDTGPFEQWGRIADIPIGPFNELRAETDRTIVSVTPCQLF